ncbi:hypothetical protein CC2G_000911 [Coprinopsis cinerea AmutBmut pab1-1]|nr:hypothetical protein CC2G_000911 [Coprinopsis cinerea AmutBmut pab1-1]
MDIILRWSQEATRSGCRSGGTGTSDSGFCLPRIGNDHVRTSHKRSRDAATLDLPHVPPKFLVHSAGFIQWKKPCLASSGVGWHSGSLAQ